MYQVPLAAIPNQAVSFNVDGAFWQVRIFQAITHMCADIRRNGQDIIRGIRCVSGEPLMPYSYMYAPDFGNFVFDGEPDWTNFDQAVSLMYLNKTEFAAYSAMLKRGSV
jgi:hypothetical protein